MAGEDFHMSYDYLKDLVMDMNLEEEKANTILKSHKVAKGLSECGMTLIHLACHLGNVKLAKSLIDNGVNINCKSSQGSYPVHVLCARKENQYDKVNILELFLKHNVDVNVQNHFGQTAVLLACLQENVQLIEVLIKAGCDINIPDRKDCTPFSVSCRIAAECWYFWNADRYENMDDGRHTFQQDDFPSSMLCQTLLRAGANPSEGTVLPSAILYSSDFTVKAFLSLGMDVNCRDRYRRTPLGSSCCTKTVPVSMVSLLLEHGAKVNKGHGRKVKPLILAYVNKSVEKIKVLLSYGASLTREEMSELVCLSLTQLFLENPEVVKEESVELLSWKLMVKCGFRPIQDVYSSKLKQVYLCSSYDKMRPVLDGLLFPLLSLKDVCRISIRSQLLSSIDENINKLPLPNSLKSFLQFDDFSL